MFDFAWSEIALTSVVALVLIGPKDMPVAIRTVARMVRKARRVAGEFQNQMDDMLRDTELHEVSKDLRSLRRMNLRGAVEHLVDNDGAIRRTLRDEPYRGAPTDAPVVDVAVLVRPDHALHGPPPEPGPEPAPPAAGPRAPEGDTA